jgi:hypothetical protein
MSKKGFILLHEPLISLVMALRFIKSSEKNKK